MTGVQSVDRAFAVLRAVATGGGGVSDIARRTGLAVSTTARLLGTLEAQGAVTRDDPGPTYRIGPAVTDLAATADPAAGLVGRARAHLEMLVADVGESAGISIAAGDAVGALPGPGRRRPGRDPARLDRRAAAAPRRVERARRCSRIAPTPRSGRTHASGLDRYTEHTVTRVGRAPPPGRPRRAPTATPGPSRSTRWASRRWRRRSATATARWSARSMCTGPSYRLRPGDRAVTRALLATAARI